MYKQTKASKTTIKTAKTKEGETIESKMRRILNNGEPITDGAPLTYTERKDGVQPQYDIRTDRFELAVDAMDKIHKDKLAKREERMKPIGEQAKDNMELENKTETKKEVTNDGPKGPTNEAK